MSAFTGIIPFALLLLLGLWCVLVRVWEVDRGTDSQIDLPALLRSQAQEQALERSIASHPSSAYRERA